MIDRPSGPEFAYNPKDPDGKQGILFLHQEIGQLLKQIAQRGYSAETAKDEQDIQELRDRCQRLFRQLLEALEKHRVNNQTDVNMLLWNFNFRQKLMGDADEVGLVKMRRIDYTSQWFN